MRSFFFFTLLFFLVNNLSGQVKILNDSIPPGRNFNKAIFRLWYKDDIKFIKGIIVLMPGSNGDGRNGVEEPLWKEAAIKNDFALLGCWFTDLPHENMAIENYINVKEGSGQALLDVISLFAAKSGHEELSDAPLFLWGMSAGGEFNFEFVCWKPERVLGFVVNKGGVYYSALAPSEARKVPGIFFTGEKDIDTRSEIVKGLFSMNRRFGAVWAFAEEPGIGHETGNSSRLAVMFLGAIIPLRCPADLKTNKSPSLLNPVPESTGFAGDWKKKGYVASISKERTSYATAWLPDNKFADAWINFIKGLKF